MQLCRLPGHFALMGFFTLNGNSKDVTIAIDRPTDGRSKIAHFVLDVASFLKLDLRMRIFQLSNEDAAVFSHFRHSLLCVNGRQCEEIESYVALPLARLSRRTN